MTKSELEDNIWICIRINFYNLIYTLHLLETDCRTYLKLFVRCHVHWGLGMIEV